MDAFAGQRQRQQIILLNEVKDIYRDFVWYILKARHWHVFVGLFLMMEIGQDWMADHQS